MADALTLSVREPADDADPADIVAGIRRLIAGATLDCACRTEIDQLLLQFERLTAGRHRRRRLDRARYQRQRIAAIARNCFANSKKLTMRRWMAACWPKRSCCSRISPKPHATAPSSSQAHSRWAAIPRPAHDD